ncbi:(d)CMP kinase [Pullulanibacillus sp. KACC 23026]|uniref:(d)CMP kinase n=1 Tax=Pullulanibacillus sp. KACC 23026 TaxID=3028315 RepID=UPI0023AED880|nr:(d)CMP kinase [Pullulanibacillus sp. KACC 23026]WEG11392.1 (d)CMP kinase [Pullulanibacillus sp. KACC 23026]
MDMQVAIDGPAAAGKSTVAKIIADRLQYVYIDTGAMYRALTLKAAEEGIEFDDEEKLAKLLEASTIELDQNHGQQRVYLNHQDVTEKIREPWVSENVSMVAQHAKVRQMMVEQQQMLARSQNVVMDGRDIGTSVLPNADVKIFLKASVKERAERRYKEQIAKGIPSSIETLEEEIATRDRRDTERKTSPLVKAEDAVELDTTSLSINEVVEKILSLIEGAKIR